MAKIVDVVDVEPTHVDVRKNVRENRRGRMWERTISMVGYWMDVVLCVKNQACVRDAVYSLKV